jgi:putative SOS response-associated peptidase YedK
MTLGDAPPVGFGLRYNLAPTQPIPVVRQWGVAEMVRWGLIHTSPEDQRGGPAGINVRGETLRKAHYRELRSKRCLVVTNGFYEWSLASTPKIPHLIAMPNDAPMIMGGVYDEAIDAEGVVRASCAIVTIPAKGIVANIHDRMPLLLAASDYRPWLDVQPNVDSFFASPMIEGLTMRPVSRLLNVVSNDDASVLDPSNEPVAKPKRTKTPKPDPQGSLF